MKTLKLFLAVSALFIGFAACDKEDGRPQLSAFEGVIETDSIVDLGLSVKWASFNVGANSPAACGDYFACGEDTTRVYYSVEDYIVDSVVVSHGYKDASSKFDAAKNRLPEGYQMPNQKQVDELIANCKVKFCTYCGVYGYAVTGPNGKSIFFPCAGYKTKNRVVNNDFNPTYQATYWYGTAGAQLYFKDTLAHFNSTANKYLGRPIRPVVLDLD